eukprot:984637-Amorphochlora_amoeboformis.AAC.2
MEKQTKHVSHRAFTTRGYCASGGVSVHEPTCDKKVFCVEVGLLFCGERAVLYERHDGCDLDLQKLRDLFALGFGPDIDP